MKNKNYKKIVREIAKISKRTMPNHNFHNFKHALRVYKDATKIAKKSNCSELEIFLLQIGAFLHDIVFKKKYDKNEEESAELAEKILKDLSFTQ